MTGFLKRLFGGGATKGPAAPAELREEDAVEYKGCRIYPQPQETGGNWLTAGLITKEFAGETRRYSFVRADTFTSKEQAASTAIDKARRIVDEQGDKLFGDTE